MIVTFIIRNFVRLMVFGMCTFGNSSYPIPFKFNLSSLFKVYYIVSLLLAEILSAKSAIFANLTLSLLEKQTISVWPFLL